MAMLATKKLEIRGMRYVKCGYVSTVIK